MTSQHSPAEVGTQGARFIKAAQVSDVPPGATIGLKIEGKYIALANVGGRFYAINDICTHLYCNLSDGWLTEYTLLCPCHDATFDVRTGKNLDWHSPYPVEAYPVRVEGNDILIEL